MKELFSKRLKDARKIAGFSQDDLVEAMAGFVSKTAIAKYERAEMFPDSQVVAELSKALGVVPEYFSRYYTASISHVKFRKKAKLLKKELDSIDTKVSDFIERYLELEHIYGVETVSDNPIAHLTINNADDVENAAIELLDKWKIGQFGITGVLSLLEQKGIRLIGIEAHTSFDGFSGYANDKIPVVVYNTKATIDRIRLTALHETGHLFLKFSQEIEADPKLTERLCYRFGAALLMPAKTMRDELGAKRHELGLTELSALKRRYGISVSALIRRAYDLGIINESMYVTWNIKLKKYPTIETSVVYNGTEMPTRFDQLLVRAVLEDVITMGKAADLTGLTETEVKHKYSI